MSPTDTADNFAEKQHFAEEVGLFFERSGMTRMAGRILGWLLVCDPPHQTLNDLAEALGRYASGVGPRANIMR